MLLGTPPFSKTPSLALASALSTSLAAPFASAPSTYSQTTVSIGGTIGELQPSELLLQQLGLDPFKGPDAPVLVEVDAKGSP